jgi:hypothetical protein
MPFHLISLFCSKSLQIWEGVHEGERETEKEGEEELKI